MLVKCKCDKCSGELEFDNSKVGGVAKCPSCGGETELVAPPIPPTSAASANRCFFVWLDDKAEGPLREDQLLDLSAKFPEMSWCRPDDGRWRQLSSFAQDLKTASEKKVAEEPQNTHIIDYWRLGVEKIKMDMKRVILLMLLGCALAVDAFD